MIARRKLYVVEYLGDLPRTRQLGSPESFYKLEHVYRRLRALFLPNDKGGEFPDPEDDRIVVWEFDTNTMPPTSKVVWAFNGWHWHHDVLPGMSEYENSTLPGCSKTLYQMACEFYRV